MRQDGRRVVVYEIATAIVWWLSRTTMTTRIDLRRTRTALVVGVARVRQQ